MEASPDFNTSAETTLQMDTSKKGPGASLTQKVTPMNPEDDIQLPFRKANMISTRNPTHNSTRTPMSVQPQDSLFQQVRSTEEEYSPRQSTHKTQLLHQHRLPV